MKQIAEEDYIYAVDEGCSSANIDFQAWSRNMKRNQYMGLANIVFSENLSGN
ncbi:hypothetical protein BDF14DRAFT_1883175 [Spinellus fusiger]|nr:hypothetical protein BDF14DRAFT_1883175 [Spinellus fusiger]